MVAEFKAETGYSDVYLITRENAETVLGRNWPWFRPGQYRNDDQYFAICPDCNNTIQLKAIYRRHDRSPAPYGSHVGKPLEGFPIFDEVEFKLCEHRRKGKKIHKSDFRAELNPVALQLIDMAVSEFDRVVYLLRQDFEFPFSKKFAEKMLDQWFDSKGYLYIGAHLRNLPWMIAYFGPTASISWQFIGKNAELTESIREKVSGAKITEEGQLLRNDEGPFLNLKLQCLHHQINKSSEQMILRVLDFSRTNLPAKAPTIYKKTFEFDPERFERLIHTPPDRARRDEELLEMAKKIARKRGFNQ